MARTWKSKWEKVLKGKIVMGYSCMRKYAMHQRLPEVPPFHLQNADRLRNKVLPVVCYASEGRGFAEITLQASIKRISEIESQGVSQLRR